MTNIIERLRHVIAQQIAKVLDEEGVKPPLRPQAWSKIDQILRSELQGQTDEAMRVALAAAPRPSPSCPSEWRVDYIDWFHKTRGPALKSAERSEK